MTAPTVEDLLALLVEQGMCDARSLDRARRMAEDSNQRADRVLIQLGIVTESGLAQTFATLLHIPIVPASRYPAEPLFPDRLGVRFLRQARAMPISIEDGRIVLAAADPLDLSIQRFVAAATTLPVSLEVAVPIELDAAFERLYPAEGDAGAANAAEAPLEEDAERLKDLASEAPIIRLVNQIIARAVETHASDIHLEPFAGRLRVRYRYDGVLHEADSVSAHLAAAITSRVKIMSRLDIAERRLPQDGRIQLAVRGTEIDFRVSTVPSQYGETVVLRVLDRSAVVFDYARLGLTPAVVARLDTALASPNGIVLVTGPTGSGKTTTLYTSLLSLNAVSRNIVTVEDPVEYQLEGVNQLQVKPQIGLNFAQLLRSILRQDPDVIMVGEIRDLETAQISVQAALTGHLVLSTVHANSAASTVTRLRDMGLEDYLMTAVLRGVLAQRLVRRLCLQCRREVDPPAELTRRFKLDTRTGGAPVRLWQPVGCEHCRGSGYRGRQAIAEFLEPSPAIERLIYARATTSEIEREAVLAGMTTMFDAGMDAALAGTTTIEDVARSIRTEG